MAVVRTAGLMRSNYSADCVKIVKQKCLRLSGQETERNPYIGLLYGIVWQNTRGRIYL